MLNKVTVKERSMNIEDIRENMKVVGSDGAHVGTVDGVEGNRIKLNKNDSPNGEHNFLIASDVASIEDGSIKLSRPADEVLASFTAEKSIGEAGGTW